MIRRVFSQLKPHQQLKGKAKRLTFSTNPIVVSVYRQADKYFPNMVPRIMKFKWSDLVVYCELFFVGLMIYIHFIDP